MSAPSFSSFPPSFSTFPDLDSAQPAASSSTEKKPSSVLRSKPERKKEGKRKQSDEKNKRGKDREGRDESAYRSKHREREREREHHKTDEYLKEREDSYRRGLEGPSSASDTLLTVFSDRKGDLLNVKYGGLHAGDIPKYYIVGRKYSMCAHFDMLIIGP